MKHPRWSRLRFFLPAVCREPQRHGDQHLPHLPGRSRWISARLKWLHWVDSLVKCTSIKLIKSCYWFLLLKWYKVHFDRFDIRYFFWFIFAIYFFKRFWENQSSWESKQLYCRLIIRQRSAIWMDRPINPFGATLCCATGIALLARIDWFRPMYLAVARLFCR